MKIAGEVEGNGSVVVMLHDSAPSALLILEKTLFSSFRHLGIPFCVVSVAEDLTDALFEELILRHPALVFPQSGTCERLSSSRLSSLVRAHEAGLGLILYEARTGLLPGLIRDLFSLDKETPEPVGSFGTVTVEDNSHYITWLKGSGEELRSDSPAEYSIVDGGRPEGKLLRSEGGHSLMLLSSRRSGRAVLFPFSIELYTMEYIGHACGLDDVFSRSLVWSARKPFFTWSMPPVAGLVIDDCSGSYDHFGYLDTLNGHGWSPYLSLFTDTIDEIAHEDLGLDSLRLKRGWEEGSLEIGFHALRYNESFCFDHLGRRPLNREELDDRFARWDHYLAKWKVRHSPWLHPHFGEISSASIPYYRERGIEFVTYLLPLDAAWFDVPATIPHISPQPPYGHNGYYINELPGFPDLLAFNCVLDRKTRMSSDYVVKTDYLWGNTCFWSESEFIDIGAASRTLADQIKRGLDSGFYGEGATHEQRIACLRKGEIREIFEETDRLLARHNPERRRLGEIMAIEKKRRNSRLVEVDLNASGTSLRYSFSAKDAVGTECQIHTEGPEGWPRTHRHAVADRQASLALPRTAGN